MQLKLTATTNLDRATVKDANGAEMHNEHDPNVKHDNVQIIKSETKYNSHFRLADRNELLHEHYDEMIEKHNQDNIKRFNDGKIGLDAFKKNQWDLDYYLNHAGKEPKKALTTFVMTIGSLEDQPKIFDALGYDYEMRPIKDNNGNMHDRAFLIDDKQRKEWIDLITSTYKKTATSVNKFTKGLKITDMWVHFDEGGMPHAQGTMVNMGHTASGKTSYNLNRALAEFDQSINFDFDKSMSSQITKGNVKKTKTPNGRSALKNFRRAFDDSMIYQFNKVLTKKGLNTKLQVQMIRKGGESGLSMSEYQTKQANLNAQNTLNSAYETLTGEKAVDKDNNPLSPLETSKRLKKASEDISTKHKDEEATLEAKKQKIAKQEKALQQEQQQQQVELQQIRKKVKEQEKKNQQYENYYEILTNRYDLRVSSYKIMGNKSKVRQKQLSQLTYAVIDAQEKLGQFLVKKWDQIGGALEKFVENMKSVDQGNMPKDKRDSLASKFGHDLSNDVGRALENDVIKELDKQKPKHQEKDDGLEL